MTEPELSVDSLYADVLAAGESVPRLRDLLRRATPDEKLLLVLLRRALPVRLLELLGTQAPWSDDARVLGAVVLNPRTPTPLAQRLLPSLFWRDLADVAVSPRVTGAVRIRAESVLRERLPEMRLGDRISLGRIATPVVLTALLSDPERRVVEACLLNPRLREQDLLSVLRRDAPSRVLLETVTESTRWRGSYNVRLALVLQPLTPLALALAQIRFLTRSDLRRLADAPGLLPLLRAVALRAAESRAPDAEP